VIQAPARVERARILGRDRHERDRQQRPHLGLGGEQPRALLRVERLEHRGGELVGEAVELAHLGPAGGRHPQLLGAPVGRVGRGLDEAVALQRAQHAREVAGVQPQPHAHVARRRRAAADLEEHPQLAERTVAHVVAEPARLAHDQAVEAAHQRDVLRSEHSLT
jgi:hypothetical protein